MDKIHVSGHLKIHDGKLDEFKKIARACLKSVRENDKGTLQYEWFFNADQSVCAVQELYADSNAMLDHMGNLGETLGALLSITDMSAEMYGNPSPELLTAIDGMGNPTYNYFQGL